MIELPQNQRSLAYGLSVLVGRTLSSVEFVQDYLQLRFDGPYLTAYTLPTITAGPVKLNWAQPGYRDGLCTQIGHQITQAGIEGEDLLISFDNDAVVGISFREDDYQGPEALEFVSDDGKWVA